MPHSYLLHIVANEEIATIKSEKEERTEAYKVRQEYEGEKQRKDYIYIYNTVSDEEGDEDTRVELDDIEETITTSRKKDKNKNVHFRISVALLKLKTCPPLET